MKFNGTIFIFFALLTRRNEASASFGNTNIFSTIALTLCMYSDFDSRLRQQIQSDAENDRFMNVLGICDAWNTYRAHSNDDNFLSVEQTENCNHSFDRFSLETMNVLGENPSTLEGKFAFFIAGLPRNIATNFLEVSFNHQIGLPTVRIRNFIHLPQKINIDVVKNDPPKTLVLFRPQGFKLQDLPFQLNASGFSETQGRFDAQYMISAALMTNQDESILFEYTNFVWKSYRLVTNPQYSHAQIIRNGATADELMASLENKESLFFYDLVASTFHGKDFSMSLMQCLCGSCCDDPDN